MSIRRVVPNIASDQPDACREFYAGLLGFQVAMDLGWILSQRAGAERGRSPWRRRDALTADAMPFWPGGATPNGSEAAAQGCLVPARSSSIVFSTRR